jgi:glycine C-acetyltransferase
MANTKQFREGVSAAGFNIKRGTHPIVPVMIGDAKLATALADELLDEGIYVIGFSYPVVPKGEARVRVQLSAAHSTDDVAKAVDAFTRVGTKLGIV